ncbi:hypothetical protein FQR65_LT19872 [Abscondita terminalis]|nr:hypothetical protein FQR65_LT19872 [Abscondita terminalis]
MVKPKGRKKINNKVWKVSIGDAWKSFSSEVRTVADISPAINKRKQFCIEKKITLQPFLIVVGDREEDDLQFALICTHTLKIININAQYGGATHRCIYLEELGSPSRA